MNDPQDARWRAFVVEMLVAIKCSEPFTIKQADEAKCLFDYYTKSAEGKETE